MKVNLISFMKVQLSTLKCTLKSYQKRYFTLEKIARFLEIVVSLPIIIVMFIVIVVVSVFQNNF